MTPERRVLRRLARRLPPPVRRVLRPLAERLRPVDPDRQTEPIDPATVTRTLTITLAPPPTGAPDPGEIVLSAPGSMYVPRMLQKRGLGGYERYGLDCFLAMVDLAPPGAAFDIGANVGVYGHLAAAYSERDVHLFEPTPGAVEVARAAALRPGAQLTVIQTALGEENGTARLYLSDRTDSSNSLDASFRPHTSHLDVPVERLDDYVKRTGVVPAVVKIDTETTEPQVLQGACDLLMTHRPWLMIEVLAERVEERLMAVLAPYGYSYYHLDGPGRLRPAERIVGDPTYAHLMYLALPEPAPQALWDRMAAWRDTLTASTVTSAIS